MISVCTGVPGSSIPARNCGLRGLTWTGSGHATTLRFSRKGDYLASGRVDGKVVIWYAVPTSPDVHHDKQRDVGEVPQREPWLTTDIQGHGDVRSCDEATRSLETNPESEV